MQSSPAPHISRATYARAWPQEFRVGATRAVHALREQETAPARLVPVRKVSAPPSLLRKGRTTVSLLPTLDSTVPCLHSLLRIGRGLCGYSAHPSLPGAGIRRPKWSFQCLVHLSQRRSAVRYPLLS